MGTGKERIKAEASQTTQPQGGGKLAPLLTYGGLPSTWVWSVGARATALGWGFSHKKVTDTPASRAVAGRGEVSSMNHSILTAFHCDGTLVSVTSALAYRWKMGYQIALLHVHTMFHPFAEYGRRDTIHPILILPHQVTFEQDFKCAPGNDFIQSAPSLNLLPIGRP